MREIKFRLWDNTNKKMHHQGFGIDAESEIFYQPKILGKYDALNSILDQFTGLTDKNGKEIYEGDIVKYQYHLDKNDKECFYGIVEYHIRTLKEGHDNESFHVGFILRGFDLKHKWEDYYTELPDLNDIKKIGNIHENPELLNEAQTND